MKTVLSIVSIVVLAVGGSVAYSISQHSFSPLAASRPKSGAARPSKAAETITPNHKPVAQIDELVYDFDRVKNKTMDLRHNFVIRNTGNATLEVTNPVPSCKLCVFVDSLPEPIPPGASGELAIRWNVELYDDDTFRRSVTVRTTDPERPEVVFVITGKVVQPLVVTPRELELSRVPSGSPITVKVRLDAYFVDDLQLRDIKCLDEDTAAYFDVEAAPVDSADLAPSARSGAELVITVKPGLPLGRFQQRIRLATNVEENPEVTIPVAGTVKGDVGFAGTRWDEPRAVLRLGAVKKSQNVKEKVTLYVRGPSQEGLVLGPPKVFPDWLVVTCSEPARAGKVTQAVVTVEVPRGAPTGDYSVAEYVKPGEIIIPTNQPSLGDIKLQVSFAVVED
ncbi:MAG TPA: DUF1573 domain-containing protein [Pirellulales bacterium]|nr:DUF1573 domain-containing protein [Pirellulales bacterium]